MRTRGESDFHHGEVHADCRGNAADVDPAPTGLEHGAVIIKDLNIMLPQPIHLIRGLFGVNDRGRTQTRLPGSL